MSNTANDAHHDDLIVVLLRSILKIESQPLADWIPGSKDILPKLLADHGDARCPQPILRREEASRSQGNLHHGSVVRRN